MVSLLNFDTVLPRGHHSNENVKLHYNFMYQTFDQKVRKD